MTEQPDIFGEIHEDELVKIAREAAEKRRQEAEKFGGRQQLDGTVEVCRGYAIWTDFEEYIERRKREERLKLSGWHVREIRHEIKETLLAARWTASIVHREARFYPPSTELEENQLKL